VALGRTRWTSLVAVTYSTDRRRQGFERKSVRAEDLGCTELRMYALNPYM
jgi:hypothetical protein